MHAYELQLVEIIKFIENLREGCEHRIDLHQANIDNPDRNPSFKKQDMEFKVMDTDRLRACDDALKKFKISS